MGLLFVLGFALLGSRGKSEVHVFVEEANGLAWIKYECTAGEQIRAFPLDVTVDQGVIIDVSDFFRGPSTASAQGYGLFPAAFRDHLSPVEGTNINWATPLYTPLAVVADDPSGTLPGLGSSGVTLAFGALWDPSKPATFPQTNGTLCTLAISQGANVTVTANVPRGGVVAADPDMVLAPVFSPAFVQPPEVMGVSVSDGQLTITFAGGELETAPTISGPWSGTRDTSGQFIKPASGTTNTFYRVRSS